MKKKIDELTRKEILSAASPEPWKYPILTRTQGYTIHYAGATLDHENNLCVVSFKTSAFGHSTQIQRINLRDFWEIYDDEIKKEKPMDLRGILNLVISNGDVEVYCTCPHWVFGGYAYMATQLDYAYYKKEPRFPRIKNPRLQGTVCKHVFLALKLLPNNLMSITSDIKRQLERMSK